MSEERRTLLILAILFVAMVIAVIIAARKGRLDQLLPTDPVDEFGEDHPHDMYVNSRKPQKGDRRWSGFFGSMIEMRTYKNDRAYSFRILTGPYAGSIGQGKSPWSSLPLWRPDDAPVGRRVGQPHE